MEYEIHLMPPKNNVQLYGSEGRTVIYSVYAHLSSVSNPVQWADSLNR